MIKNLFKTRLIYLSILANAGISTNGARINNSYKIIWV